MGSGVACMKICDPAVANSFQFCNNIYDETGCDFVAPASVRLSLGSNRLIRSLTVFPLLLSNSTRKACLKYATRTTWTPSACTPAQTESCPHILSPPSLIPSHLSVRPQAPTASRISRRTCTLQSRLARYRLVLAPHRQHREHRSLDLDQDQ